MYLVREINIINMHIYLCSNVSVIRQNYLKSESNYDGPVNFIDSRNRLLKIYIYCLILFLNLYNNNCYDAPE